MANYDITLTANGNLPDLLIWNGIGGSTSSAAFGLVAGDTVRFRKGGMYSGSVSVSGFASGLWTSTSNLTLTTSYQTKTVKTGGTAFFEDMITGTAGNKTQNRWFEIAGVSPDLAIDDIDDVSRPTGSTDHSITIGSGTSTTTYEVRTGSASGTIVGTRDGNGAITVSNIPSAGSYRDYYVTGKVTTANGGENVQELILSYTVVHESGTTSGDGGTSDYGLQVFNAAGQTVLDVTDRVIVFSDYVTGTLTTSETTKNVTLSRLGTAVIDMLPITDPIVNEVAQRHKILHTTISGTTLTIQRTSTNSGGGSAQTADYKFLVVYDPEA